MKISLLTLTGIIFLSLIPNLLLTIDATEKLDPKKLAEEYGVPESEVYKIMQEKQQQLSEDGTFDKLTPQGIDENLHEFQEKLEKKMFNLFYSDPKKMHTMKTVRRDAFRMFKEVKIEVIHEITNKYLSGEKLALQEATQVMGAIQIEAYLESIFKGQEEINNNEARWALNLGRFESSKKNDYVRAKLAEIWTIHGDDNVQSEEDQQVAMLKDEYDDSFLYTDEEDSYFDTAEYHEGDYEYKPIDYTNLEASKAMIRDAKKILEGEAVENCNKECEGKSEPDCNEACLTKRRHANKRGIMTVAIEKYGSTLVLDPEDILEESEMQEQQEQVNNSENQGNFNSETQGKVENAESQQEAQSEPENGDL